MQTNDNNVQWFVKCFSSVETTEFFSSLEKLDESIGNFYRNPLTRTKTFLGGFRDENFEISGKTGATIDDETFRNNADRLAKVEIFVIFLFLWTIFIKM